MTNSNNKSVPTHMDVNRAAGPAFAKMTNSNNPNRPTAMIGATIFQLMGIDSRDEFLTPEGRPIAIANGAKLIRELL